MDTSKLDLAVAKVKGFKAKLMPLVNGEKQCFITDEGFLKDRIGQYAPSTDWSQCGPLIEEYKITIDYSDEGDWEAIAHDSTKITRGPTPLIAACRALVASKPLDE